jgi:peptidoglycan/xylan/chitin deacetylase (PgdA/CDA1 family)
VGLNVEHFMPGMPSTSIWPGTATLNPDPLNHGWRDYGVRVGIWRMMESLDRHGIRASVLLNSMVPAHYPQIIEAGLSRDWAWLAHGRTNSVLHTEVPDERAVLTDIVDTIEAAVGRRPLGWMGPGLTETPETPALLAELGLKYVLDWTNDDQPYRLNVPGMISVPYTVELNDLMLKENLAQAVQDQYEVLSAEGGRVLALALHPFVTGQAFRAKYFDQALKFLAAQPDVWLTTSDEIAEHYLRS